MVWVHCLEVPGSNPSGTMWKFLGDLVCLFGIVVHSYADSKLNWASVVHLRKLSNPGSHSALLSLEQGSATIPSPLGKRLKTWDTFKSFRLGHLMVVPGAGMKRISTPLLRYPLSSSLKEKTNLAGVHPKPIWYRILSEPKLFSDPETNWNWIVTIMWVVQVY